MWDSHFRVGGASGTDLQLADCPKLTGDIDKGCMAATLLLHLTTDSSGYFENVWAWYAPPTFTLLSDFLGNVNRYLRTADHDMDATPDGNTTDSVQINVYSARGILIESQGMYLP